VGTPDQGESWQGELINKRKDGTECIELVKISPIRQADGRITHYMSIKEDITERKRAEERIQYLANFDALTGLPNRAQLEGHVKYAISLVQRSQGELALMFLDLDNFKDINDTLGHTVGDALLIELAKRLQLVLRDEDTVSRLGGDEFIFLLPFTDATGAAQVAQKLLDIINQPYQVEQYNLNLTASIGIALYPGDGLDLETLSKRADTAMYRVKQEGRHGYRFFTAEMQARTTRNLQLGNELRLALERDQLQVYYQPQLSMQDGRIIGRKPCCVGSIPKWRGITGGIYTHCGRKQADFADRGMGAEARSAASKNLAGNWTHPAGHSGKLVRSTVPSPRPAGFDHAHTR